MKPLIVSLTAPESVPVIFVTSLPDVSVSMVNCPTSDLEGEANLKL